MAKVFLAGADPDQVFLLPVDVREWLPGDHPVHFFMDVVDRLDVTAFDPKSRRGGVGRAGFDPRVLLGVLLLGYSYGHRSSRVLERLCQQDVAFRMMSRGLGPDHTTIARFRSRNEAAVASLFAQVLVLCAEAGLVRLDVVAVDGTRIPANAARSRTIGAEALGRRLEAARERARQALAEAAEADAREDAVLGDRRGDELPADLVDRDARVRRIIDLQEQLQRRQAAADKALAAQQQREREQLAAAAKPGGRRGRAPAGVDPVDQARAVLAREEERARRRRDGKDSARKVKPVAELATVKQARAGLERAEAAAAAGGTTGKSRRRKRLEQPPRINTTDPQSGVMTSPKGWIQGYNTQLAVSGDHVVLAVRVVADPQDTPSLVPMMDAAQKAAALIAPHRPATAGARIGTVLADAGYSSRANITAPGPDRLIAPGGKRWKPLPEGYEPGPDSDPVDVMHHRLLTDEGKALYKRRGATVEPVNGHLKTCTGLRQFSWRGINAAQAEATLAAATLNLCRLMRTRTV